ncbi:MAG: mechanosensitive ion channel [Candidatus Cloacimonas sp.]|jgi:small conductance mechanosensitive channel|nr:mechanosensitive ion channel [Candidatus Cloacimonas sp.]
MTEATVTNPSAWAALLEKAPQFLSTIGLKLIAAILIYVIGKWVAKMIANLLRKIMVRSKVDPSLVSFVGNLAYAVILIFVIIAAIGKLGVQTTSFIALIGAAGLAVGMALQGSLANFAAGVMLILFKLFKVGDAIIGAGVTGTVHDIGIFHCTILTSDNRKVIVPNAKLSNDSITNFTAMPTRRIELSIAVPGTADISASRELLLAILNAEDKLLKNPPPAVSLNTADAAAITFGLYAHVNNADLGAVQAALVEKIKLVLTAKGIWA